MTRSAAHRPEDPALNAVVDASAGTGKTYLLVSRMIRLLLDGARPDGLLALTFTRKAAAEMRERLLARLRELALADEAALDAALEALGVPAEASRRAQARRLYETLLHAPVGPRITTFHAFCQELLQRFPLEAGVPPGYTLLENAAEWAEAAWDALCLEASRKPDGTVAEALATLFARCRTVEQTRRVLLDGFLGQRSDWWAWCEQAGEDPAAWAAARLAERLEIRDETPPAEGALQNLQAELETLLAGVEKLDGKNAAAWAAALWRALDPRLPPEQRLAAAESVFWTQKRTERRPPAERTLRKALGGGAEAFQAGWARLAQAVGRAAERQRRWNLWALNRAWYRAGAALLEHFQRIKRRERLLDFADLEWRACRLLGDPDHALWVQYKLDQRIDHLLLDEFQDTNPTQWRLLRPLLEELAAGQPERPRSVFLVGDPKQSIYAFRRADPRLQAQAAAFLEERLGARRFPLERSRRCAPAIVELVNAVFDEGGPAAGRLADFQRHETLCDGAWGRVELLPLVEATPTAVRETLRDPLREDPDAAEDDAHRRAAAALAARLRALLDAPPPIDTAGGPRPLGAGDILILLRRRTHAAAYERALAEAGIPYQGLAHNRLLDTLEGRDVYALLRHLATPLDNLALAQVLRSPLFGADDAALLAVAAAGEGPWSARLERAAAQDAAPPALRRAHALLARWRGWVGRLPVHDLLNRIFLEGELPERYRAAAEPRFAPRVLANLQAMLEMALRLDSGRYPSLMRFLERLERLRELDRDAPQAPDDPAPVPRVRLMTVHGAKGLEAPVVCLADAAARDPEREGLEVLVDWPPDRDRPEIMLLLDRGAALPDALDTLRAARRARAAREEANLLYVALTRARHVLIVSAAAGRRGLPEDGWYRDLGRALERLGAAQTADGGRVYGDPLPAAAAAAPAAAPRTTPPPARPEPLPVTPPGDDLARRRGRYLHRLLEDPQADPAIFALPEAVAAACRSEAAALRADRELAWLFAPAPGRRIWREQPLVAGRPPRLGVVDCLVETDQALWVIDYKSETPADFEDAAARHRPQLQAYAEAVRALWPGKTVRAAVLFTAARRLVELALDR
ncbi:MAG: double-strand break repair helicase AddA [Gammaproteobacteria bacterium]|nr:MAG: double-strand break repair helicase AddA [Gammaproteobacteria bacterium]